MIRRKLLHFLRYLATCGICLGIVGLIYQSWGSGCTSSLRLNSRKNSLPLQNQILIYPKKITLVSVMCHGPPSSPHSSSNNHNATTPTTTDSQPATSRKGISRQMTQLQVMLKSLLLMEHEYLRRISEEAKEQWSSPIDDGSDHQTLELILYTDYKEYYDQIVDYLYNSDEFSSEYLKPLRLIYSPVIYPKGYESLKYFFRPCTTLRLFMDRILPSHNEVIYLDTDIIFFKPVRELYNEFSTFNSTQWAAMGMDWYHHHSHRIPYYGRQGLNAGVGLYNLTKMRTSNFSQALDWIFKEYLNKTKYADQDILNIYFHFHPQELKLLPCHRNFIPNYCRTDNLCPSIAKNGVTILHGITMSFMPETLETQFLVTFQFFKSLKLNIVQRLEKIHQSLRQTLCQSEKKLKLSFTFREENCARNINFANVLLGEG